MARIIGICVLTCAVALTWFLFALNCIARNAILSEYPYQRDFWRMKFFGCYPSRAVLSVYYTVEDRWYGDRYLFIWRMKSGEIVCTK